MIGIVIGNDGVEVVGVRGFCVFFGVYFGV